MKRWGFVVALALSACANAPAKPKPTAQDVATFKHEEDLATEEALLNAPWSGKQRDAIAAQGSARKHHVDQLAEAAGIATTAVYAQEKK